MKKRSIILSLISLLLIIGIISCSKTEDKANKRNDFPEIIELIQDCDYVHCGNLTPSRLHYEDNVAWIGFMETPNFLTIHLTDEKSQLAVDLFNHAIANEETLKIFAKKNSREIVQVNQLDEISATRMKKRENDIPPLSRSEEGSIATLEILKDIDFELKDELNYGYVGEGCYAKAHAAYRACEKRGIQCFKLFFFAKKGYAIRWRGTADCEVKWSWHVVTVIPCQEKEMTEADYFVVDALPNRYYLPRLSEWLEYFAECNKNWQAIISYRIDAPRLYSIDSEYTKLTTDDNFQHTDCMLNALKYMDAGCEPYYFFNICPTSMLTIY